MRASGLCVLLVLGCGARASEPVSREPSPRGGAARVATTGPRRGGGSASPSSAGSRATAVVECTWRVGAPLPAPRRWHAHVVLADGRVLVAGGGHAPTRTDVYEPARDRWRTVGPLGEARSEHTLTLLADGRVLAVGGTTTPVAGSARLARTAEIFDPATERWVTVATAGSPRFRHRATRLADGRVLVTGGSQAPSSYAGHVATTEIFDPRSGTWQQGPSLGHARAFHSATLLEDGRVIVIGGQVWADDRMEAVPHVEVLDAAQSAWSRASAIPEPRSGHTTTALLDGQLLVVGGWNRDHGRTLLVDRYDPRRDRWSEAGELAVGRDAHAATLLPSGHLVVVGGQTNGSVLRGLRDAIVEVYDPSGDRWTQVGHPPGPRMEHTAVTLHGGDVLLFGGVDSHYDPPLDRVEIGRCR